MTDLVGDHVRLRELATLASNVAAAKAALEIVEKSCVEIDLLIVRTIERPHGRLRKAAGRPHGAGEHYECWRLVVSAGLGEDVLPLGFCASQHRRQELTRSVGSRLGRTGRLRLLLLTAQTR